MVAMKSTNCRLCADLGDGTARSRLDPLGCGMVQVLYPLHGLLFRPDPASEGVEAVIGFSDVDGAIRVQSALLDDLLIHRPAVIYSTPYAFLGSLAHIVDACGDVVSDEMGAVLDWADNGTRLLTVHRDSDLSHHRDGFDCVALLDRGYGI